MPPKLLIIEDDNRMCQQLAWGLKDDFNVLTAGDRAGGLSLAQREHPRLILLDLGLPPTPSDPEEGLRLLQDLRRDDRSSKVLVYTGHDHQEHALRAISYGASDVLVKPLDIDALRFIAQRACRVADLEEELARQKQEAEGEDEQMIGTSEAIRRVFGAIRKVATADVPVLIVGESGTGKELTAKAIHERSTRQDGPFQTINCGAIPETLLEAELFGYEKGAFTGAVVSRKGKLEFAQRGTLFLDEIGELTLALQVKLLRFLQDRTIERVGGRQKIEVDARIIAATNVDLKKAIETGAFREDLYYRLGVVTVVMPPLRDRGEDAVVIAQVFLKRISEQAHKRVQGFTKEALAAIEAYGWPGNVRELSNKIRRAVAMAEGSQITPEDLDLPFDNGSAAARPLSLKQAREHIEAALLRKALARHAGNLTRVADELGISRPTLYALLRKYRLIDRRGN